MTLNNRTLQGHLAESRGVEYSRIVNAVSVDGMIVRDANKVIRN